MKRDYSTKEADDIQFFIGTEIEHTPAFGMKTLFVVGIQSVDEIYRYAQDEDINHIFFGANHSFNPNTSKEWFEWESMIVDLLEQNFLCSLDIPINKVNEFNDCSLNEKNNFIPQIRVPIPYIKLWNYNTMVKIDDAGFNHSNPGIWTHRLHDLMDIKTFTNWNQYKSDRIIK